MRAAPHKCMHAVGLALSVATWLHASHARSGGLRTPKSPSILPFTGPYGWLCILSITTSAHTACEPLAICTDRQAHVAHADVPCIRLHCARLRQIYRVSRAAVDGCNVTACRKAARVVTPAAMVIVSPFILQPKWVHEKRTVG